MNKKNIIVVLLLLVAKFSFAIPAFPGLINFQQPDGTYLEVYLKGDERVRWAETTDGYSLLFNKEGFYEYAIKDDIGDMRTSGIRANGVSIRTFDEKIFLNTITKYLKYSKQQISMMRQIANIQQKEKSKAFPTTGDRKLVCILMGFADKPFAKTQEDFNMLFNQIGYNVGGATGSVYDYFLEASYQQLRLETTVLGPYEAANNMSYYGANTGAGGNDANPDALVLEALNFADADVDFATFDNDLNATVDGVYIVYAGIGEESGGGSNAIWAHASSITPVLFDGVYISRYSCSAEFRYSTYISSIGVICHEFGHVLGAPDFYDVDYSESGGDFLGTGDWDLQASGSWTNSGKTPSHPNAYTKCYIYEWATPIILTENQEVTMLNSTQNPVFYRYDTKTANEFYLLENKQKIGSDSYVPGSGLLIYHADGNWIESHTYTHDINAGSHQGLYPVCASATVNPSTTVASYGSINSSGCTYPGSSSEFSFTDETMPSSLSWAGATTKKPLTNISNNTTTKIVSFTFANNLVCTPPTAQATDFFGSNTSATAITANWTRGTGDKVIVVSRRSGSVNTHPENGSLYQANASFGTGSLLGTNNYVVYIGTENSFTMTNLTADKNYYFAVYEYLESSKCYLTPPLTGVANSSVTAIANISDNQNINIFPNPTKGIFNLNINNITDDVVVKIFSIEGQLIYEQLLDNKLNKLNQEIDLTNCRTGAYFVWVSEGNNVFSKILIIE